MPDDILEAAGPVDWSSEMPGRWHVDARSTHVVVALVGGTAMLTPQEAHLLENALSTAKQLVSGSIIRAAQMGQMGQQETTQPGAEG